MLTWIGDQKDNDGLRDTERRNFYELPSKPNVSPFTTKCHFSMRRAARDIRTSNDITLEDMDRSALCDTPDIKHLSLLKSWNKRVFYLRKLLNGFSVDLSKDIIELIMEMKKLMELMKGNLFQQYYNKKC